MDVYYFPIDKIEKSSNDKMAISKYYNYVGNLK